MTRGIGDNGGPALEGRAGRRYAWTKARADLLPTLPIEVVRMRVRRARDLGLAYRSYATIRATTGRDVIAILFSVNALAMPRDGRRTERMTMAEAVRGAETVGLLPDGWPAPEALDRWTAAPGPWAAERRVVADMAAARAGAPADGTLLVGAAPWERAWASSGRLAGYLSAEAYFAP